MNKKEMIKSLNYRIEKLEARTLLLETESLLGDVKNIGNSLLKRINIMKQIASLNPSYRVFETRHLLNGF